jgi:hypothetical protein
MSELTKNQKRIVERAANKLFKGKVYLSDRGTYRISGFKYTGDILYVTGVRLCGRGAMIQWDFTQSQERIHAR